MDKSLYELKKYFSSRNYSGKVGECKSTKYELRCTLNDDDDVHLLTYDGLTWTALGIKERERESKSL